MSHDQMTPEHVLRMLAHGYQRQLEEEQKRVITSSLTGKTELTLGIMFWSGYVAALETVVYGEIRSKTPVPEEESHER